MQDYRAGPTEEQAAKLRLEFDALFSTRTLYAALDDRIAKTAAKKDELLTVLDHPEGCDLREAVNTGFFAVDLF